MTRKKFIKIAHGQKGKIVTFYNTSYPTVNNALSFVTNHKLAVDIREYALNECGGEICYSVRKL